MNKHPKIVYHVLTSNIKTKIFKSIPTQTQVKKNHFLLKKLRTTFINNSENSLDAGCCHILNFHNVGIKINVIYVLESTGIYLQNFIKIVRVVLAGSC